jgi:hypothetical protein
MSDRIEELRNAYETARLVSDAADAAFDAAKSFKAVCDDAAAKAAFVAARAAAAAKAAYYDAEAALEAAEREVRGE